MGLESSLGGHKMEPNAQIKQEGGRFNFLLLKNLTASFLYLDLFNMKFKFVLYEIKHFYLYVYLHLSNFKPYFTLVQNNVLPNLGRKSYLHRLYPQS